MFLSNLCKFFKILLENAINVVAVGVSGLPFLSFRIKFVSFGYWKLISTSDI